MPVRIGNTIVTLPDGSTIQLPGAIMMIEIESAVVERLRAGGLPIRDAEIQKGTAGIVTPRVLVSIEAGDFSKISQKSYRWDVTILVSAVFKNWKSEGDRRRGLYPILEGIVSLLMLQTLGLDIQPIRPLRMQNITDDAMAEAGLFAYQISFSTSFTVNRADEEEAADLLRIGLEYYLHDPADDGISDAQDIVELEEEE
ncbi:MAG: hypothetical protein APR55_07125 [Methanolinea sp. SDB]|nr:MAG: hypothetical protein APR55_07125 [Methanolinea sp. SDB]